MKTKILDKENIFKEIDWDEPQLLKSKNGRLILCTGESNSDPSCFTGVAISDATGINRVGYYSKVWGKAFFKKAELPITIEFNND